MCQLRAEGGKRREREKEREGEREREWCWLRVNSPGGKKKALAYLVVAAPEGGLEEGEGRGGREGRVRC